uniref:TPX2 central domain-containing protein n=1 Tax=Noccaea caerulescens TaxID=107243 RepID=A0A1J3GGW9_NOCCA
MQHSSAVSTGNHHYRKGSEDKADTTALLDGVNREPRRQRATDIPKDDDRKQTLKARPLDNKMVSSRRDIGIFRKSKRETTVPLPTDLFSKLSIKSELQPNNGTRLRFPLPEQGSKENRLKSFQAGNERTSSATGKQRGLWTTRR